MTHEERQILSKLYFKQISRQQFLEQYPIDLKDNETHIFLVLKDAFDRQNKDDLNLALTLAIFGANIIYTDEFVEVLCHILKGKWHQRHEDIVSMLQVIKSPKSIDTLY